MRIGKMIELVDVERFSSTVNEAGTPVQTWARIAKLRAEKVDQSTSEFIRNFGASDEEIVVFRIHAFADLTNADRLLWRGEAFNIKQLSLIGRTGLELRCARVV